ncbi:DUF7793 family protein [Crocinitomix catalasitica]|uniref:DUF7793 family protein n=1 Tax=Crocinitomix catalasitica TaxID=184607 RepID=UPI000484EA99|nr:STAS/SEC14 domain-containing protein [Crocinitomix catalasitica]
MGPKILFEAEFYRFMMEDGVFHLTYIDGPITLAIAKKIVLKRLELTNNESVPLLIDGVSLKSIDKEARNFLSSADGIKGVTAAALLSNSPFTKYMANFFLKISANNSKIPARVFNNQKEAVEWLQTFKK